MPTFLDSLGPAHGLRDLSEQIVADAVRTTRAAAPGVVVSTHTETSSPLPLPVEMSRQASYVVVGSRGLGVLGSLVAGSTTVGLMARAHAPVLTYGKPPREDDAPVVLGGDGSPENAEAIAVAFDTAAVHQRRLVAIYVVRTPLIVVPQGGGRT